MAAYRSPPPVTTEDTITVEVDGVETVIEVTCEFDYTAEDRGSWSGGLQQEPDYPASADLLSAKDEQGKDWYDQVTPADKERLECKAVETSETLDEPDYEPDDYYPDDYIGPD